MNSPLSELRESLIVLADAHESLRAVLDEEREALTTLDVKTIHACAHTKAELIQTIQTAEQHRRQATHALCEILGLEAEGIRLRHLIEKLPESCHAELHQLRDRLTHAANHAQERQSRNRSLTERFLGVLNGSMQAVHRALSAMPTYTTQGKVGQGHVRGCVVSQHA